MITYLKQRHYQEHHLKRSLIEAILSLVAVVVVAAAIEIVSVGSDCDVVYNADAGADAGAGGY